jgi:hypothetical protein
LPGVALFDRLDTQLQVDTALTGLMWERREIENYFCSPDVLRAYAAQEQSDDLFGVAERDKRKAAMQTALEEVTKALQTLGKPDPRSADMKATDDFLDPVFRKFFEKLKLPLQLRKSDYHILASLVPKDQIDPDVSRKLSAIAEVARKARPFGV